MMASTDIKEGFLCPICMKDLGTVIHLQEHFESAHSNEDKAVINQLKGTCTSINCLKFMSNELHLYTVKLEIFACD